MTTAQNVEKNFIVRGLEIGYTRTAVDIRIKLQAVSSFREGSRYENRMVETSYRRRLKKGTSNVERERSDSVGSVRGVKILTREEEVGKWRGGRPFFKTAGVLTRLI